ncbi:hypothetical protein EJ02DRAFT_489606, partial [Clathrospora elynae]
FIAISCARVAVPDPHTNLTSYSAFDATFSGNDHLSSTSPVTATEDDPWTLSLAHGTKLLQGMKGSDADAATLYTLGTTAESHFDDDFIANLREWGYNDNTDALAKSVNKECNFDSSDGHMLKKIFTDLGIGITSKAKGGPNQCFQIEHYNSAAVKLGDGGKIPDKADQRYDIWEKEYRITNAEPTLGVNADAGAVYAMQISSAAKATRPAAIRSVSDIAWAFWNRAQGGDEENMRNVQYFFVTMIINKETNQHVKRALGSLSSPKEEADAWPGHRFGMDTDAGKALLGSHVGRRAGYFLMQHKRQLGGTSTSPR